MEAIANASQVFPFCFL